MTRPTTHSKTAGMVGRSPNEGTEMPRSTNYTDAQLADEFDVDLSIETHTDRDTGYTFRVGDDVTVVEDNEEDGTFSGDEGVVVGFWHRAAVGPSDPDYAMRAGFGTAGEATTPIVEFDGQEPRGVKSGLLEVVA